MNLFLHFLQRLQIVQSHQIETEAVEIVFTLPVRNRLDYEFSHHRAVGSRFVTATRTVRESAVFVESVIVIRYDFLEIRIGGISVVVNYVHYNADTVVVQSFYHLLVLVHPLVAVGSVG